MKKPNKMKQQEFELVLQEGEGQYIEFKEIISGLDKEIVAFANSSGGKIFLGVDDKSEVKGIKITNKLKSQIQDIARNCDPSIVVDLEKVNNVLIVNVEEGKNKPYFCKDGFYIRMGANSQKMKRNEIIEVVKNNTQFDFDNIYCRNKNGFDFKKFSDFLKKWHIKTDLNNLDILRSMKLVDENKNFSNASFLLFAEDVQNIFPYAYLECVLFKDEEGVNIIDRKRINGDLFEQLNEGMIFIKKHLKVKYEFPDERRREIYDVPIRALEEALVNALIHRDYSFRGSNISLFIYPNKIEILSPGGLAPGFGKNDFGNISIRRNELVADIFSKTDYVEKIGRGVKRMKNLCNEQGNSEPKFNINSFFIISFDFHEFKDVPKNVPKNVPKKLSSEERRYKILEKIRLNEEFTKRSLAVEFGVDAKEIQRDIKKLKDKIEFIGSKKGGKWRLKK